MLMMKTIEFFHCLFKKRAHHKIEGLYLLKHQLKFWYFKISIILTVALYQLSN